MDKHAVEVFFSQRCRAALSETLRSIRHEQNYFNDQHEKELRRCRDQGIDPPFIDPDEEQFYCEQITNRYVNDCTDAIVAYWQQSRPWVPFARSDIRNVISDCWPADDIPEAESIVSSLSSQLPGLLRPFSVSIHLVYDGLRGKLSTLLGGLDDGSGEPWRIIINDSGVGCIEFLGSEHVRVLGMCTQAASAGFGQDVLSLLACCLSLAGGAYGHDDPVAPDWDSAVPPSRIGGKASMEQQWEIRVSLCDFGATLQRVITLAFHVEERESSAESAARQAMWMLSYLRRLGLTPLALVAATAVAEKCLSVRLRRENEPFSQFVRRTLELSDAAYQTLDRIVQARNAIVHNLQHEPSIDVISRAWRLAWVTTRHLVERLANVSGTENSDLRAALQWVLAGERILPRRRTD